MHSAHGDEAPGAGPLDLWASLDNAWQEALRQAWEAVRSGNIGVGAVVARPDGEILRATRNRVADSDGPPGEIAGSSVAHAEINALARIPFRLPRELRLTTTLQPCLQCSAAIRMAPIATVRFAGADPLWDGCHDFSPLGAWPARRPPVPMDGPRRDELGEFAMLLSYFGLGLIPVVEETLRGHGRGPTIDLVRRLEGSDRWSELTGLPVEGALAGLWPELQSLTEKQREGGGAHGRA